MNFTINFKRMFDKNEEVSFSYLEQLWFILNSINNKFLKTLENIKFSVPKRYLNKLFKMQRISLKVALREIRYIERYILIYNTNRESLLLDGRYNKMYGQTSLYDYKDSINNDVIRKDRMYEMYLSTLDLYKNHINFLNLALLRSGHKNDTEIVRYQELVLEYEDKLQNLQIEIDLDKKRLMYLENHNVEELRKDVDFMNSYGVFFEIDIKDPLVYLNKALVLQKNPIISLIVSVKT
ncbi:hypothetical protein BK120_33945 [Paenibacillus sp. FSL A5-0031]|uniref:hypothetical protein n=1 Tax=Paenibacillus sp. FSL A5-0031 TaxID=1920420 RepID=UPI00096E947A|nr:hypothetical protein [Paenibacillus sp. FSL A5-0031]OME69186.1 hypothetical protein BK120_33945 [Paenibacillus sp. FSL A5-0031]